MSEQKPTLKEVGPFRNGKQYKYGECTVLQTIDICWTVGDIEANFGTNRLPVGQYKHTSISCKNRYPTWEELKEIKELLHGDKFVMQILPPKIAYVNVHENCFHLWEII